MAYDTASLFAITSAKLLVQAGAKNDNELISQYTFIASLPEVNYALYDILYLLPRALKLKIIAHLHKQNPSLFKQIKSAKQYAAFMNNLSKKDQERYIDEIGGTEKIVDLVENAKDFKLILISMTDDEIRDYFLRGCYDKDKLKIGIQTIKDLIIAVDLIEWDIGWGLDDPHSEITSIIEELGGYETILVSTEMDFNQVYGLANFVSIDEAEHFTDILIASGWVDDIVKCTGDLYSLLFLFFKNQPHESITTSNQSRLKILQHIGAKLKIYVKTWLDFHDPRFARVDDAESLAYAIRTIGIETFTELIPDFSGLNKFFINHEHLDLSLKYEIIIKLLEKNRFKELIHNFESLINFIQSENTIIEQYIHEILPTLDLEKIADSVKHKKSLRGELAYLMLCRGRFGKGDFFKHIYQLTFKNHITILLKEKDYQGVAFAYFRLGEHGIYFEFQESIVDETVTLIKNTYELAHILRHINQATLHLLLHSLAKSGRLHELMRNVQEFVLIRDALRQGYHIILCSYMKTYNVDITIKTVDDVILLLKGCKADCVPKFLDTLSPEFFEQLTLKPGKYAQLQKILISQGNAMGLLHLNEKVNSTQKRSHAAFFDEVTAIEPGNLQSRTHSEAFFSAETQPMVTSPEAIQHHHKRKA